MKTYVNIIFSSLILLVIMTFKTINIQKNKNCYKSRFYHKSKRLVIGLYILFVMISIILFILNMQSYSITNSMINTLAITLLFCPISISTLYQTSFKEEEKYSHIKYVITKEYDTKYIRRLNTAGIKVIYLTKEAKKLNDVLKDGLKQNITSINAEAKDVLKNIEDSYYDESIKESYDMIKNSRGVHDNYIRTLKFNLTIYISLFFTILTFIVQGFPLYYNIFNIMILKLITYLLSEYVYKYLPFDTDIMIREPKEKNILMGFQEWMITILEAFCVCFTISIPYMFILASGGGISLTYTILTVTLLYFIVWYTYAIISEKIFIRNIMNSLSKKSIILTIGAILLTIIILFLPKAGFTNIGIKNYIVSLLISLIPIIFIEITKLARYSSVKGRKKHAIKNNKKYR